MGEALHSLLIEMASLDIEKPESSITLVVTENLNNNDPTPTTTSSRRLRNLRSTSEECLHKINRRTIQRPKKQVPLSFDNEKDAKDFYVTFNKKNQKVKPNLLETIYEETDEEESLTEDSLNGSHKDMGKKKLKRAINCCDGLNVTKALTTKRKAKVKHFFNARKKPRKIALAKFMEYFKEKICEIGETSEQQ
jgi:hypothetical protein